MNKIEKSMFLRILFFIWSVLLVVNFLPSKVRGSDINFNLEFPDQTVLASPVVIRGPYLQTGTPTSVVVRWRTDVSADSRVSYGDAPDNLTTVVDDPASTTEHEVLLPGLVSDTKYYYSIGTTTETLAGADNDHFFMTSPPAGIAKPTRIWIIGDSGTADANVQAVRDAYLSFAGTRSTDVWLMLGDNAYLNGTDLRYQTAVFDMYPMLLRNTLLWPTLGNHDAEPIGVSFSNGTGPYFDMFTLPAQAEAGGLASGTEVYYSFDYGNIHFINMNSTGSDRSPGSAMLTWLENDIAATSQDWVIAYWHHPPYTHGSHNSDNPADSGGRMFDMRENVLPILESYGVDLVFSGHSHSYERSFLIDGHYGTSNTLTPDMILDSGDGRLGGDGFYSKATLGKGSNEGAVYVVAGSSGLTGGGTLDHPVMFISLNVLGSVVLDIDGSRLDAKFIDSNGGLLDYFIIVKSPPVPDIKANGSDGPVTIPQASNLIVTVSLDSGSYDGDPADWRVYADTPLGWYHYILSGFWIPGLDVTYSGPLSNLSPYEVWNGSEMPIGSYTICFDVNPGLFFSDCVEVTVN